MFLTNFTIVNHHHKTLLKTNIRNLWKMTGILKNETNIYPDLPVPYNIYLEPLAPRQANISGNWSLGSKCFSGTGRSGVFLQTSTWQKSSLRFRVSLWGVSFFQLRHHCHQSGGLQQPSMLPSYCRQRHCRCGWFWQPNPLGKTRWIQQKK